MRPGGGVGHAQSGDRREGAPRSGVGAGLALPNDSAKRRSVGRCDAGLLSPTIRFKCGSEAADSERQMLRGMRALLGNRSAAVPPAGNDGDSAWLAGALEQLIADNPNRAELLQSRIAACKVAERLRGCGPVGGVDRDGRFELMQE